MPQHHKLQVIDVVDPSWCSAISLSSSDAWCRMSCGNTPPDCPVDMCSCPAEAPVVEPEVQTLGNDTLPMMPNGKQPRSGKMVLKNEKTGRIEELEGGSKNDCNEIWDENICLHAYRWVFGTSTMTSSGLSHGCSWVNNHYCVSLEGDNETDATPAPITEAEKQYKIASMTPEQQYQSCLANSETPTEARACKKPPAPTPVPVVASEASPVPSPNATEAAPKSSPEVEHTEAATKAKM